MPFPTDRLAPDRTWVATLTAFGAAAALLLELLERWLVRRPQPFTDPYLVAADDAIRARSLRAVAGAGIAVLLLILGSACWTLAMSDVQVLRWTMWIPAFPAWVLALWSCTAHNRQRWVVRRRPQPVTP